MTTTLRWVLTPLAALVCLIFAGFAGAATASAADYWDLLGAGFSAAFLVVVCVYLVAPKSKIISACIAFVIGAALSWLLLEPSFLPEGYGTAYEQTHLPIILALAGGLVGLILAGLHRLWSGPNNSFKPNRLRRSA